VLDFLKVIFERAPSTGLVRWGPLQPAVFITMAELETVCPSRTDLFFGPAVRSEPDPTKKGVVGSGVVWLDYDGKGVPVSLIPPSIVVASGGPGKFHFYWLLDSFVDPDTLEACNKAVAEHQREEEGTWERTRLLRVPGSLNSKYKPPADVRLVAYHPERVYSPDDIARLQIYDPSVLKVTKTRSERDWRIATLLLRWGVQQETVTQALSVLSGKAEEDQDYAVRTVAKAAEKVQTKTARAERAEKVLSNFAVAPVGRLASPEGKDEGLLLKVWWSDGEAEIMATQQDFESKRSVNHLMDKWGLKSRTWAASDRMATDLWIDLVEQCPAHKTVLVRQAGRYDLGTGPVFVYGREEALGAVDSVFWSPQQGYNLSLRLEPGEYDKYSLTELLLRLNKPSVISPCLGWVLATPFKTLIESYGVRYPVLLAYGLRGSGKTTLLRMLLPLVGQVTPPVGADVTRFALLSALASSNSVPVWIGEFRMSLPSAGDVQMVLRLNYDGGAEERGRPDLSVVRFELGAPVAVDGEALFADSAMRERTLSVRLSQTDVLEGTPFNRAMSEVSKRLEEFPKFAHEYLSWTLTAGSRVGEWLARGEQAFRGRLPYSRLYHAASVAYLGLLALQEFVPGLAEPDADAIYDSMLNSFAPGLGVVTPVERLAELMAHMYRQEQHWALTACVWDEQEKVLWVNLTSVLHWIRRFVPEIPDRDMLLPQVEERVGVYLRAPKTIEGGRYYGIDILRAQSLGLDCPIPRDRLEVY